MDFLDGLAFRRRKTRFQEERIGVSRAHFRPELVSYVTEMQTEFDIGRLIYRNQKTTKS